MYNIQSSLPNSIISVTQSVSCNNLLSFFSQRSNGFHFTPSTSLVDLVNTIMTDPWKSRKSPKCSADVMVDDAYTVNTEVFTNIKVIRYSIWSSVKWRRNCQFYTEKLIYRIALQRLPSDTVSLWYSLHWLLPPSDLPCPSNWLFWAIQCVSIGSN